MFLSIFYMNFWYFGPDSHASNIFFNLIFVAVVEFVLDKTIVCDR